MDAVKYAVQYGTSAAAREFDVCDRMIRKWKVDVEKLQGCDKKKRAFRGSGPKDSEMEKQLVDWILDLMVDWIQPLDVAVNKPFKDMLKKAWELWMQDETKAQYTKGGRRKRCSYEEVASMVHDSFYSIEAETIQNGFIKALERDPDDEDIDEMEIQELDTSFSALDLEC